MNEWIPIKDKKPEWYEHVLITVIDFDGKTRVKYASPTGLDVDEFRVRDEHIIGSFYPIDMVKAWMPLPEPYADK